MSLLSMSTIRQRLSGFELSGLGIPFLVLLIMAMLVIPLPPLLLDILFTFNILVSVVVIMIAIGSRSGCALNQWLPHSRIQSPNRIPCQNRGLQNG